MKEFDNLLYHLVRENPRKFKRKKLLNAWDKVVIHALERALAHRRITDQQFRANLKLIVLTGHENTQQMLNAAFWKLGTDQVRLGWDSYTKHENWCSIIANSTSS